MSAALQQTNYIDPTRGMELTTGDEIALEATRHLFLAGDMIDPHRKDDLPHLSAGGEELSNYCLRRTGGYLPRCTITPLELWAEWLPIEYFPEGVRPLKLKGQPVKDENPSGMTLVGKPLFGYPHYPGELIVDALEMTTGVRRGIVEIDALRGLDADSPDVQRMQALFFPADWIKPIELRLIKQRVEQVAEAGDSDVKAVAAPMLLSVDQWQRWAEEEVSKMHTQLDQRVSHQWTHRYSPKVRLLMRQLEIEPRSENALAAMQTQMLEAMSKNGMTPELLTQMEARDSSLVSKLVEGFSAAMAQALRGAQPPTPAKPK